MKEIHVWPYPVHFKSNENGSTIFLDNFTYTLFDIKTQKFIPFEEDEVVFNCIKRYDNYFFQVEKTQNSKNLRRIKKESIPFEIVVSDVSKRELNFNTNETYTLEITNKKVILFGETIFSVIHGFESLYQLINNRRISSLPISILDYPRYKWRGLLLDVCNHFIPLDTIKEILDSMSFHKLNVFHFHMIDTESFPMPIPEYPLLQEKGSYDPLNAVFSENEIKDLVDYAYLRGIRIVPAPGHCYSWSLGYPQVLPNCPTYMVDREAIPINPVHPISTEISKAILDELNILFPDEYVHFGGDEVVWEDKEIDDYMKKHGYSPEDMERVFMDPLYKHAKTKIPIHWQERIEEETKYPIPENSIIQIWKDPNDISKIIEYGYPIINSGGWYFDQMTPVPGKKHYAMLDVWKDMYHLELDDYVIEEKRNLILGGEGAMWSEQINEKNVIQRIWPKGSAVAERLWSEKEVVAKENDVLNILTKRLMNHICHGLIQRGINASPIQPDYCAPIK